MGISNLYKLSCVVTSSGQISQITDEDVDLGITEMLEGGSGSTEIDFAAIGEQKPMINFTTTALATALGITGVLPMAITDGVDFYFSRRVFGGGVDSSSTHIKLSTPKIMLTPKTARAEHGQKPASLEYTAYAVSTDGVAVPMTVTNNVALPAVGVVSELFTLGPVGVTVSATTTLFTALSRHSFDFGFKEIFKGSDGNAYPTFCGIDRRQAKITLSGDDLSTLSTYGVGGTPLAGYKLFFRKILKGGTRVPDATANHIKISGTTGMLRSERTRGSHEKEANVDWMITPTFDGTNNVVVLSTASAIA